MTQTNEAAIETVIEAHLLANGYVPVSRVTLRLNGIPIATVTPKIDTSTFDCHGTSVRHSAARVRQTVLGSARESAGAPA